MEPFADALYQKATAPDNQPQLTAIMAHLQDHFATYRYTVYRCAAKIVALQKAFHTTSIPYKLVNAVFVRHGIHERADVNLMVPPFQLTSLIHDVYFACEKLGHFTKVQSYHLESSTSLLANFFWDIFDPHRRHSISQLELKATFLIMCRVYSSDKVVSDFYNLVCDPKSRCVSKYGFQYLAKTFMKILSYIGEGNAYGPHNLQIVIEQCFARHHNTMGLTEYQFYCLWSTTQTRFLIYANLIALVKRIEDTEKLIHNNLCGCCAAKIVGIRFKCQSCRNLSLCLKCFATGYSTNKHEAGHRMCEVFSEDLPPRKMTHYLAKLCAFFCNIRSSEETTSFCHSNEVSGVNETEMITFETNRSSNGSAARGPSICDADVITTDQKIKLEPSLAGLSTAASNASDVSERLQSIIDRLLQQNIKLENQLKSIKTASNEDISEFLSSHQKFLIEIISEMRHFSKNSSCISSYPTSSTPNRSVSLKKDAILDNYNSAGGAHLTHSINGADLNRSYLDANKSDYSITDLSLWFNQRRTSTVTQHAMPPLGIVVEAISDADKLGERETEMTNFKLLLTKVKEIVEDSYSDNTELAEATQNLENVLDSIIISEESRRRST